LAGREVLSGLPRRLQASLIPVTQKCNAHSGYIGIRFGRGGFCSLFGRYGWTVTIWLRLSKRTS